MQSPTNLLLSFQCSSWAKEPSRLMYSTCLTAETFVPLGFLSDLSLKWNIATKILSLLKPTAGSRSDCDWQIFSADKRRHDAGLLAFHEVKCGSEHFRQKSSLVYHSTFLKNPMHYFCTIFWAFYDKTKSLWYSLRR